MHEDERVLRVAERWFRSKLRGDTVLLEHELDLFEALASRQDAGHDVYVPKDPSVRVVRADEVMSTTLPPPSSGAHANLIQQSKASFPPFPLRPKR